MGLASILDVFSLVSLPSWHVFDDPVRGIKSARSCVGQAASANARQGNCRSVRWRASYGGHGVIGFADEA